MHEKLLKIVRTQETDYEPYGKVERDSSDCSSGCRHFAKLAGEVGEEWGVCANPESARVGLLTFQHKRRCCAGKRAADDYDIVFEMHRPKRMDFADSNGNPLRLG